MVARMMEKRVTERDMSPPAKASEALTSDEAALNGVELPDPAKDPEWQGISGDMAKEFGEADPASPANARTSTTSARPSFAGPVDETPIKINVKVPAAPALPTLEDALSKSMAAVTHDTAADSAATAATLAHLKKQIEALQGLLKQEHDERVVTEAIVKELSVDNRRLRDELSKASVSAATAKAALDAREELLQHLKEEVSELRTVAFKRG